MNQSRKLTEGALFVALYMVIMLASFIPILAAFVLFLLPVPFVIYASRHGAKSGLLVLVAATLLTIIFFTIVSLPLTLLMGVGGLLIGHGIYKKRSAYETWAYGTLGFIGGLLFVVAFSQLVFNVNFTNEIETIATEEMTSYITMIENIGIVEGNPDIDLEAMILEQISLLLNLAPAFLALSAVFLAFLVQWISYKVINRIDKQKYRFSPFRTLRFPSSIIWLYLIVIFISFFDLDPSSIFYIGLQNALFILEALLVIQGFSFIFFFAHYKEKSKALPIIGVVLTILFPMFLLYFVRILGIIDIGFNLRDRLTKKDHNVK